MKFLVVVALAVACASAVPVDNVVQLAKNYVESEAPILSYENDATPEGNFRYAYETANGIKSAVQGNLKNVNNEYVGLVMQGTVRYPAPDGTFIEYSWTADENGYVASGSHLPVPPPIPEGILRGLQYIQDHPPPVERVQVKQQ